VLKAEREEWQEMIEDESLAATQLHRGAVDEQVQSMAGDLKINVRHLHEL
jgi:hypothetical protein